MKSKALLPAIIISLAVQSDASAQPSATAPRGSGAGQNLTQTSSERSAQATRITQRSVSRPQAARIAQQEVRRIEGSAARGMRVTGIRPEDDFGAQWEVEVTLRNGAEYDVYINQLGRVVDVVRTKSTASSNNRPTGRAVTLQSAKSASRAYVEQMTGQGAQVTGSRLEDDYGARWEVEVRLTNGFEYDVYVARDGRVVRVEEIGLDSDNSLPSNAPLAAGREQAAAAALANIQQMTGQSNARVTGIEREDDFGAWWEVEVTLANGLEYDVYVTQDGQVIRVEEKGPGNGSNPPSNGPGSIASDQAAATALAHIQQTTGQTNARVTGIEREDDFGAQWEVEVTLANGLEYDVYVGRDGQVIRVEEKGLGNGNNPPSNGSGSISLNQAAAIALAHIQQMTGQSNARVTNVEREDDFGAQWEVEVTLANGVEYDVYVGREGQVIRVEEKGSGNGNNPPGNGPGSIASDQAAATALAHIQQMTGQINARVTGITPEDDFGAQWEVEVTLPSGLEYDVYVGRNGQVIRVVRSS